MMRRVGVFAGTFDPIHNGHIACAQAARQHAGLDHVVFLPERQPRGKPGVTPYAHRVAMLQRAVSEEATVSVLALEGSYFTVATTIPQLVQYMPHDHLVFIMGSDVVQSLPYWDDVATFLTYECVVGVRNDITAQEVKHIFSQLAATYDTEVTYSCIQNMFNDVSAQEVRRGRRDDISPRVREYIQEHGLYV